MFITFEGIEGSGKSTLLRAIAARLRNEGRTVVETREPGGTDVGDGIRQLLLAPGPAIEALTETFLVNASRAQLLAEVIEPALARGAVVLCDRYVDSTLAYQGYGRGLDLRVVRALCDAAVGSRTPDLTLLIDIGLQTSSVRVASRNGAADRMELQDRSFHERVRRGFLELAAIEADRIVVLDGERSSDLVEAAALESIGKRVA
ncbi:MAG: dTMP kinase [Candidatus Eremiobacteraeota bacterium]|nr:dTMP kinase [Candidatus Eremiobacteraeota bacterium]